MLRRCPTTHISGSKRSTARRRAPGSRRATPRPRRRSAMRGSKRIAPCCSTSSMRRIAFPWIAPARPPRLQFLAGRGAPEGTLAAHDAGEIPQRRSGMGSAARRRRAREGRRRGLGLARLRVARRPSTGCGLVQLSRGGADATVSREFDLVAKRFVDGGFVIPETKWGATWFDADTLLVAVTLGGE